MSEINILPPEIFNRIAAGEVVERPASVVKELVENSIDAGATMIRVRIERAGTKLISVSDNGRGMDGEDALLALRPHGTSKIKTIDDIDRIATLGFRGEALPSIAAVSRMSIATRRFDAPSGIETVCEAGEVLHTVPFGCAPGTEIAVRDLFFNTPARRKFLRSFTTEESYIQEVVAACALANLHISFELVCDGRQIYSSSAGDVLTSRLRDLFGRNFSDNMLPVDFTAGAIRVTGAAARPGLTRSTRRDQRGFVNGRPVESSAVYRGIRDGYGPLNDHGRYPPCVLFLHLPLSDFDINVHPAKREVRFRQEYNVSRAVSCAIAAAMRRTPAPESTLDATVSLDAILHGAGVSYTLSEREQPVFADEYPQMENENTPVPSFHRPADAEPDDAAGKPDTPVRSAAAESESAAVLSATPGAVCEPPADAAAFCAERHAPSMFEETEPAVGEHRAAVRRKVIGVVDNTYILLFNPATRSLEVVDQHAAHERVLYEELLASASHGNVAVQPLLLARKLELGRPASNWLANNGELLGSLGFEVEELSSNTLLLNAVPSLLPEAEWDGVLLDIWQEGRENQAGDRRPVLERAAAAACHAAVKAHDELSAGEIDALLEKLDRCERPDICPHGRPTTIDITLGELERRFCRK
ncbi:MAG: DNA mismatch repair endonuclease MutL [Victivallaceae bacterium]|nr:DNA mismatch repair endonuclease MutL [Victivallaceae bacterium]